MMTGHDGRLIVVSNRLPATLARRDGEWIVERGAGGLVTALAPALRDRGGVWIGWSGAAVDDEEATLPLFEAHARLEGYELHPVGLSEEEVEKYYFGFSNEIIWPLFHDLQSRCNFNPEYWDAYLAVSERFALTIERKALASDYVWVHDYQLMHVGSMLRERSFKQGLGFFLHIPFPPPDIFLKLPWRREILSALLQYDLVGFQTSQDRSNFTRCVHRLIEDSTIRGRGGVYAIVAGERQTRVGCLPISIDYKSFVDTAAKPRTTGLRHDIREAFGNRRIILGVDRLDYTKGIPQRLEAFRIALERYPELMDRVCFALIVVPSREKVSEYKDLKDDVERLVGRINGRFSRPGWSPVHYHYRNLPRDELIGWYRAADIALVTPLKDGMNLVAKEYCACNVEESGALILSEFAGAAAQLQRSGALLVNPYDYRGVADAIAQACDMAPPERRKRMRRLREAVRRADVFHWVDSFLEAAFAKRLDSFQTVEPVDFRRQASESTDF